MKVHNSPHTVPALAPVLLLLLLVGCVEAPQRVPFEQGRANLQDVDLERPVELAGDWLALRADETDPASLDLAAGWRPAEVPAYFESQGFPDEGAVWYRLDLKLPAASPPLKGYVQHANNAHALYARTPRGAVRLLASSGEPGATADQTISSRAPVTFSIPADTSLVLLWKVANFDYVHGGPFHAIHIGTIEGVDRMLLWKVGSVFALFGMFLLIGVSFLIYWWVHRTEVEALAISLIATAMAIRAPVQAGAVEYLLPALASFDVRILLEAITFLLVPGLIAILLWSLFPGDMATVRLGRWAIRPLPASALGSEDDNASPFAPAPRLWRRFNVALVCLGVGTTIVFTGIALFSPPATISVIFEISRWVYVLLAAGALVLMGQALYRRRPMAVSVATGTLVLIAAGVHDILMASGVISRNEYLVTFGFLGFILAHTYALARRYALYATLAHQNAEALREEVSLRTRELRAATIAAHAANLAKSHFLSAVSHELRSPLASIMGYNRILQEELERVLEPQHREFFETVRASGERLTGLVNDILDVAKIEAGMLDLNFTAVDYRRVAADVLDQLYPLSREKGLTLRTEWENVETMVVADQVRLRQVLLNLVSNAIKFTREGEIVLSVYECTLEDAPACAISVSDTGPGISEEFLPQLFERFTQEERLYNETQRGTGLGLSISRELITRMNGTIEVESVVGEGSTFTVTLPRAERSHPEDASTDTPARLETTSHA